MDERDLETLRVRLMLIEGLALMAAGAFYVERAQRRPDEDTLAVVRQNAVDLFDSLAEAEGCNPSILDDEASRLLAMPQTSVALQLRRAGRG